MVYQINEDSDLAGSRNHRGSERGLHNTSPYNEDSYYLFIDGL